MRKNYRPPQAQRSANILKHAGTDVQSSLNGEGGTPSDLSAGMGRKQTCVADLLKWTRTCRRSTVKLRLPCPASLRWKAFSHSSAKDNSTCSPQRFRLNRRSLFGNPLAALRKSLVPNPSGWSPLSAATFCSSNAMSPVRQPSSS